MGTRVRGNGWRAWIPLLASLWSGCAGLGILGPGPPDVTVYDLPKRPAMRAVPFEDEHSVYPASPVYRLEGEPEGDYGLGAGFSVEAWSAFRLWLVETLARFNANRCGLLALNGKPDERCRLGGGLAPSREEPALRPQPPPPAPKPQGAPAGWATER